MKRLIVYHYNWTLYLNVNFWISYMLDEIAIIKSEPQVSKLLHEVFSHRGSYWRNLDFHILSLFFFMTWTFNLRKTTYIRVLQRDYSIIKRILILNECVNAFEWVDDFIVFFIECHGCIYHWLSSNRHLALIILLADPFLLLLVPDDKVSPVVLFQFRKLKERVLYLVLSDERIPLFLVI